MKNNFLKLSRSTKKNRQLIYLLLAGKDDKFICIQCYPREMCNLIYSLITSSSFSEYNEMCYIWNKKEAPMFFKNSILSNSYEFKLPVKTWVPYWNNFVKVARILNLTYYIGTSLNKHWEYFPFDKLYFAIYEIFPIRLSKNQIFLKHEKQV